MNYNNTLLVNLLLNTSDAKEIIRSEIEKAVNTLLATELTEFLKYEKHSVDGYNTGNSRNGYYSRTLSTSYGDISISVPRDRNGEFKSPLFNKYARRTESLEDTIILMYKRGLTTREISDLIEKMYGSYYSPQTISNITAVMQEQVDHFHNRPLANRYAVIFCDATYVTIKRGVAQKEALHILLGITPNGQKEIIDYAINPSENTETYKELLLSFKKRGVEQVDLFVSDGFVGLPEAIQTIFPDSMHQRCWVHIQRNISRKVRVKDREAIASDLKRVYTQPNEELAIKALREMLDKWHKYYPKIAEQLSDISYLFSFYSMPDSIRQSIYSTNILESFNKHFKRSIAKKEQFPNEESIERYFCSFASDYNVKFFNKCHRGFKAAF